MEIDSLSLKIYGKPNLEPVLLELMRSKPLKRLKKIQQHGPVVWAWKHAYETRYDHSVGVMLLIRRFGGTLEEQIAGLLHDVSHTAFSHVVDFMSSRVTKSFHDESQEKIIRNSEIPLILKKYKISLSAVIKSDRHRLLDSELPDLCADRVDYCFRDGYAVGFTKIAEIKKMLQALTVRGGEIVFSDRIQAKKFAKLFIRNNKDIYAAHFSILFHRLLADAIEIGLQKGIISEDDLFSDDIAVKAKLLKSGNAEIKRLIGLISQKTKIVRATKNYDYHLKTVRVRVVDPKVLVSGKLDRLSMIDREYSGLRDRSNAKQTGGFFVKIKQNRRGE